MDTKPLSWLKQLEEDLSPALKIPLWGSPPPFPWEALALKLADELEFSHCSIQLKQTSFCSASEFLPSFGENPMIKTFELPPLSGTVHLIVSRSSLESITEIALSKEGQNFSDPSLQEGFYEYLLLCAIKSWLEISPYYDLTLHLTGSKPLPHQSSFCCDLFLSAGNRSFPARLIFSPSFHLDFSEHFKKHPSHLFSSPLISSVNTLLTVEAGSCRLSQASFNQLEIGDFLILDRCSYDPLSLKGTLTLSMGETPLFRVRIKKDKLKILDYATYFGDKIMDEDSDLDPFLPDEEESEDTHFESLEEDSFEEEKQTVQEVLSSSSSISFPIVVEIDRIQMPLKQLLSLEPGNILELSIKPEQGVYLTVHGKKIAKGELLKMGEALGVRIVELGESSLS